MFGWLPKFMRPNTFGGVNFWFFLIFFGLNGTLIVLYLLRPNDGIECEDSKSTPGWCYKRGSYFYNNIQNQTHKLIIINVVIVLIYFAIIVFTAQFKSTCRQQILDVAEARPLPRPIGMHGTSALRLRV